MIKKIILFIFIFIIIFIGEIYASSNIDLKEYEDIIIEDTSNIEDISEENKNIKENNVLVVNEENGVTIFEGILGVLIMSVSLIVFVLFKYFTYKEKD